LKLYQLGVLRGERVIKLGAIYWGLFNAKAIREDPFCPDSFN